MKPLLGLHFTVSSHDLFLCSFAEREREREGSRKRETERKRETTFMCLLVMVSMLLDQGPILINSLNLSYCLK